ESGQIPSQVTAQEDGQTPPASAGDTPVVLTESTIPATDAAGAAPALPGDTKRPQIDASTADAAKPAPEPARASAAQSTSLRSIGMIGAGACSAVWAFGWGLRYCGRLKLLRRHLQSAQRSRKAAPTPSGRNKTMRDSRLLMQESTTKRKNTFCPRS